MHISASSLLMALLSVVSATSSYAEAATPVAPTLNFLYSMNCTLAPRLSIGDGPIYNRTAIPIIGGTFTGPKLSGTIANLGADWGVTGSDGVFHPDTRYNLFVDSKEGGEPAGVYIQTAGSATPDGRIQLRMIFETGNKEFYWLNNVVGVGILTGGNGYVLIDAWEVVNPPKA